MPIFTILLVIAVGVLAVWLVQRFVQDPAKTILLIVIALLLVLYLFRVFGLYDVRV